MESESPLIYLVAGEPSGDLLGGRLMAELIEQTGGRVRFAGIGGEHMAAQGLDSLFPMRDLSVMGLAEVLPHLPRLIRRMNAAEADVRAKRPDVLLTIDSPGFCFRLARRVRDAGIMMVHYVAPTVWAWKPGRAKKIAAFLDHLLVLLPFEPPYFEREGLAASFVGHPVVDAGADSGDGAGFRARHGIPESAPLLCVLPGSRLGEVRRHLPVFGETVERLAAARRGLWVVAPTLGAVADPVRRAVADWPLPAIVVEGSAEKHDAFAASDAALAASGTVTLELALAGCPSVVAYRVNGLTAWLVRRLVKVEYASLINIMENRQVLPEFLTGACVADNLGPAVGRLLDDPAARAAQIAACRPALEAMGWGGEPPGRRAAWAVLALIEKRR